MPSKSQSILLGGVAMGVVAAALSLVPIAGSCLSCIAILGAGALAVWHYTDTYDLTLTGGRGAGMGALAGIVAAIASSLLGFLLVTIGVAPDPMEAMQAAQANGQEMPEWLLDFYSGSTFYVVGLVISVVVGATAGAIGGAIGAAVFKKGGETPTTTPPPTEPTV